MDVNAVFANSPLENWWKSGIVQNSRHQIVHISDALRAVILWKCGGLYADLDIMALKTLPDDYANYVSSEYHVKCLNIYYDK